jgi:hypothetical protein
MGSHYCLGGRIVLEAVAQETQAMGSQKVRLGDLPRQGLDAVAGKTTFFTGAIG